MTNDQLLQRLQDNLPEDLSLEEIELLRERARQSPELRDALAGHLYWEQFLATGLARGNLSPEQVVHRLRAQRTAARARMWRAFGWPLVLLAMAGVAWMAARAWHRWQAEPIAELAQLPAGPAAPPAVSPIKPSSDKQAAGATSNSPAAGALTEPIDPLAQFSTDQPRPFSQTCFEPLVPVETDADLARLNALWKPLHGSMSLTRGKKDSVGATLSGKFELRTAWPAGQVLRLSPIELDRFSLEIASGGQLVSLRYVDRPSPQWGAYCSRRSGRGESSGETLLAATDDDRYRRTAGGVIELRYQDGLVVLSRADVLLLAAPLSGKPDRVALEVPSRAMLGNLAFAPGEPFPMEAEPKPPTVSQKASTLAGTLPADVVQTFEADGSCQLAARNNSKPGWVTFDLPEPGTREVMLRIDAASPGTGIVLVDADDRPRDGMGFMGVKRSEQMAIGYARPTDRMPEFRDNGRGLAPLVSIPFWLRIVAGPSLKFWTSADGEHWATALDGRSTDRWQRIGIYCAAGKGDRTIRVSQIRVRSLSTLAALAEKNGGQAFEAASDPGAWLAAALAAQPDDVKRSNWLRACAAKTLAAGCRRELARALIQSLLEQAPEMSASFAERANLIDELALLSDANDTAATRQVVEAYVALARQPDDAKLWQPYSRIRRRLAQSPPLAAVNTATLVEPLVRAEILELVYHDAWDELDRLCKQVEFFTAPSRRRAAQYDQPLPLAEWAAALARRNRPAAGEPAGAIRPLWRHPLIEQLGKEGFNILAELDAALAGGSYKDACQLISSVAPREAIGLLPNSSDPALLVSLPGAVALAMRDHPPLLEMMQTEFAPLGQLRLRQATAADDVAGVEAVTIQFFGTTAARQAHVWLGDRALTAGDFSEAEAHYRRAADAAAGQADPAIAARLRLAAAMQGRSVGANLEEPLQLGSETISVRDFEKMIDDMLARSAADRSRDQGRGSGQRWLPTSAPEPASYRTRRLARLSLAPLKRQAVADGVPWDATACETSLALTPKTAIVAGPGEIAAFDRTSGSPLWKIATSQPPQRGSLWPPVATRPAMVGDLVLARRWLAGNWQLVAIDGGKIGWQTPASVRVASDPLVLDDRVLVVTSAIMPQEMLELSLAEYDPRSGQQLAQHPLAQFRDVWQHEISCELGLAGDTVVVVAGGCTLGCSRDGEARWLRRETWIGGIVDQRTWPRRYGPPLVDGELVCVAQPGVPAVSAVEASNGRLAWQRPMADLVRMLAVVSGRLIVQTARGFEALSLENGAVVWEHPAPDSLDGWLAGDSGDFLYLDRESIGQRRSRARLVWLDAKTGNQHASALLTDWQPEEALVGPLTSDGQRIWAIAGSASRDAGRELFELIPTGPAAEKAGEAWINRWLASSLYATDSSALLPGWHLLSAGGEPPGVVLDSAGRQTAVVTRASAAQPVRWLRRVQVPDRGNATLRVELGPVVSDSWKLTVTVDNLFAVERLIEKTSSGQAPAAVEVDLSGHRGKTVWLSVTQNADRSGSAYAAWKQLGVPVETETKPPIERKSR